MAIFRVWLYGNLAGQMTCNVLHFHKADAVQNDINILGSRVNEQFVGYISGNVISAQSWNRMHITSPSNPEWGAVDFSFARVGSFGTSIQYTPVNCFVMWFKTGVAGRRGLGKFYQGGVQQNWLNAGNWEAVTMTRWTQLCATLKSKWVSPGGTELFDLCVCPRNDPGSFLLVNDIVARPMMGVQRRRNLGAGA